MEVLLCALAKECVAVDCEKNQLLVMTKKAWKKIYEHQMRPGILIDMKLLAQHWHMVWHGVA